MTSAIDNDQSAIRDNHTHGTVGDFLEQVIIPDSDVSIVSAYFTIYAYQRLKGNLDGIARLRFLFGEPTFIKSVDSEHRARRTAVIEDEALAVPAEDRLSQRNAAELCAQWIREKVDVRSMIKPRFLHGKMYHVAQSSGVKKAIVGSSNFTVNGLGLGQSNNLELNLIVDSDRDRDSLRSWFDALWDDARYVEDVKEEVLRYLDQVYRENSPEFVYFKTLFHLFEGFAQENAATALLDNRTGFLDSQIWAALYEFQKDGVRGAINKILKHNGCIIADSVGLGKTFEALAVIKYFELLNYRVLVVVPKKLSANWSVYQASQNSEMNPFPKDRFSYSLLFHTDLGRIKGKSSANGADLETFNWGAFDLVVIDESHNFRGNPVVKETEDGSIRMNRAAWLMEKIIRSGPNTKVLLLSATPVNTDLRDLRNQILYITQGNDQAFAQSSGIRSIDQTMRSAQARFTNWADPKKNPKRNVKTLLEALDSAFIRLLDDVTIARSRDHIKRYYDLTKIGRFPNRDKPRAIYSSIDLQNRFPSYDSLNKQILGYSLSLFNPSRFVRPDRRAHYQALAGTTVMAFTQETREHYLIGMMKVNFLKRLESSIYSFQVTLDRTIRKIDALLELIAKFQSGTAESATASATQSLPITDDELEFGELDEDDLDAMRVGKKVVFYLKDLELDKWKTNLLQDKDALVGLYNSALAVTVERDAKLAQLKHLIELKRKEPWNAGNRKVLLFTAFADTAEYVYEAIKPWYRETVGGHCALVAGSSNHTTLGRNDFDSILTNFSPRSKKRAELSRAMPAEEIDLLIATDCISEGQNLQDCDYLINYDIHWNPVRIIQRFGRIDRLGSTNETIHLTNFWPTEDLDLYINLKDRVEARMALVDIAATGEDNILNIEQIQELVDEDLKFRNKQLLRLKDEILDLEDLDQTISLTDFTLDDFRLALLNFLQNAPREGYESIGDAPLGLYAVVPAPGGPNAAMAADRTYSPAEQEIIRPGAIFCLRSREPGERDGDVNPLTPYFLVYVYDDGEVRYNFTNARQVLQVFNSLASGADRPYTVLCEVFNQEAGAPEGLAPYRRLLKAASGAISQSFYRRGASTLTSGGRSAAIGFHAPESRFELITWLIVR